MGNSQCNPAKCLLYIKTGSTSINYLAHLSLSAFNADLQVGNYLGDLIKGKEFAALPLGLQEGVTMHRGIDRLTDTHPAVRELNALIAKRHGRYATVLSDIGFDHCLYTSWTTFGPAPFREFSRVAYERILESRKYLPARVAPYATDMVAGRWLDVYTTPAGMNDVFHRLRRRVSKPELLDGVEHLLEDYADPFNHAFAALFPDLQDYADGFRHQRTDLPRPETDPLRQPDEHPSGRE